VKENSPVAVGVPESTPPDESRTPGGGEPLVIRNEYGPVAPDAVIVCEYGEPSTAFGRVAGESVIVGQLTAVTVVETGEPATGGTLVASMV
jgi:hypothetical protein